MIPSLAGPYPESFEIRAFPQVTGVVMSPACTPDTVRRSALTCGNGPI
jgi:hypothetical protein